MTRPRPLIKKNVTLLVVDLCSDCKTNLPNDLPGGWV